MRIWRRGISQEEWSFKLPMIELYLTIFSAYMRISTSHESIEDKLRLMHMHILLQYTAII